jgi:hypothetical protein
VTLSRNSSEGAQRTHNKLNHDSRTQDRGYSLGCRRYEGGILNEWMYKGRAVHGPCTATHSGLLCFPFNLSHQQSCTSNELQDLIRGDVEIVTWFHKVLTQEAGILLLTRSNWKTWWSSAVLTSHYRKCPIFCSSLRLSTNWLEIVTQDSWVVKNILTGNSDSR